MTSHINIINLAFYRYDNACIIPRHRHDSYYQIFYMKNGSGCYVVDGRRYVISKGEFLFVSPSHDHEMKAGNCADYEVLDLKFTVSDDVLDEPLKQTEPVHRSGPEMRSLFDFIIEETQKKDALYSRISCAYLDAILSLIVREERPRQADTFTASIYIDKRSLSNCVRKVLNEVEGSSVARIDSGTVDKIAHNIGYNKKYMCKCFSDEIGVSITEFQRLLKIDKAKELLLFSEYSVKDIANMLGYSNVSYFIRIFSQNVGSSPLQYRQKTSKQKPAIRLEWKEKMQP